MDLLACYESGDSDKNSDSESSVSSDEDSEPKNTKKRSQSKSLLPSATDIFDQTECPSFLGSKDEDFILAPVTKKVKSKKEETKPKDSNQNIASTSQPKELTSIPQPKKEQTSIKKGNEPSKKLSGKDKVKNQRLNGQAGIGSDFKTWRTDQEMAMRQQFD
mmetsp:Transcript_25572/g.30304  ORF Transcript_25572/g.30304 Transcript_25572/m.30304 type:complete len:161 (-) Transcript_25572:116-598(-)